MTVHNVIKMGNPLLREPAQAFTKKEIVLDKTTELVDDLWETMEEYGGIGLAAPQVGISKQLAVIKLEEENERYPEAPISKEYVIFNPKIKVLDETQQEFWEGCLSVPGLRGLVSRPRRIQVNYLDQAAKPRSLVVEDFLATVFQHELDHLKGKLFIDRMRDISTLAYEDELVLSPEEKDL